MSDKKPERRYFGPENPTLEYYPQMLTTGNVLIINHNILRFHTYDLFCYLMLNESYFMNVLKLFPEIALFVALKNPMDKIKWAYHKFTPDFCKAVFKSREIYFDLFRTYAGADNKTIHHTPTALTLTYSTMFYSSKIKGTVLMSTGEQLDESDRLSHKFDVIETDKIDDMKYLVQLIKDRNFNGVFVDTVQMAAELSYRTMGVTYMIPTYPFNLSPEGELLGTEHLTLSELENKNEFGLYQPYTFPAVKRKDDDDGDESD